MPDAIYAATAQGFAAALGSLAAIISKAAARADASSLPGARLAPDMLPLSAQVQLACFHAANGTARLLGQEVAERPSIQEAGFAALRALIAETLEKLDQLTAADFTGAGERRITMKLQPPLLLDIDGANFLHLWLVPNFYFHAVTAYDILRANGLEIGKKDFLGHLAPFMHQGA